jgi:hypothetical protein
LIQKYGVSNEQLKKAVTIEKTKLNQVALYRNNKITENVVPDFAIRIEGELELTSTEKCTKLHVSKDYQEMMQT